MDYPLAVRRIECPTDLAENFHRARQRHRTFLANDLLERLAAQVLHHQKHHAVFGFTEIGNTKSMWMGNFGRRSCFSGKARDDLFVSGKRGIQHLDGNRLVHQDVRAAVNSTHAARTKTFFNAILSGEHLAEQSVVCLFEGNTVG